MKTISCEGIMQAIYSLIFLLLCLACTTKAHADAVGAEMIFLTTHLSDETIQLGEKYRRKLSEDGRVIITPGIEIYYDKEVKERFIYARDLRFVAAGYRDSIDHLAGYLAILPRWELFAKQRISLSFGLGPTLIFRETWNTVPEYRDDGYFQEAHGYQYKWIVGGDLDLQYKVSDRIQVVWSIVPGIPYVITHSLGVRWSF